ncbi:hypothetical protein GGX14DRAFT_565330 [Mycena pura]|uniref:Uncharacterized protein n=1 Tax=Mycena pura TaxID=153505 RepID=A0AAD6VFQ4_9AGAR|nr:hypothetical protein GGX14DRAFT_565330 [Mycena pura]
MPPSRTLPPPARYRVDTLRAAAQARRVILDPVWIAYDETDAAQYPSYSSNDPDPEPVESWEAVYDAFLQRIGPHARELLQNGRGREILLFERNSDSEIQQVQPMEGYRPMYLAYLAAVLADSHRSDIIRADQAVRDTTARCAPQADILRLLDVSIECELDAAQSAADFRAAAALAGYCAPSSPAETAEEPQFHALPDATSAHPQEAVPLNMERTLAGSNVVFSGGERASLQAANARLQRQADDFNRRLERARTWLQVAGEELSLVRDALNTAVDVLNGTF